MTVTFEKTVPSAIRMEIEHGPYGHTIQLATKHRILACTLEPEEAAQAAAALVPTWDGGDVPVGDGMVLVDAGTLRSMVAVLEAAKSDAARSEYFCARAEHSEAIAWSSASEAERPAIDAKAGDRVVVRAWLTDGDVEGRPPLGHEGHVTAVYEDAVIVDGWSALTVEAIAQNE